MVLLLGWPEVSREFARTMSEIQLMHASCRYRKQVLSVQLWASSVRVDGLVTFERFVICVIASIIHLFERLTCKTILIAVLLFGTLVAEDSLNNGVDLIHSRSSLRSIGTASIVKCYALFQDSFFYFILKGPADRVYTTAAPPIGL